jgi:hypothetical protein
MDKVECLDSYDACYTLFDEYDEIIRRGCDFIRPEEKSNCFFVGENNDMTKCQCYSDFCNNIDAFSLILMAKE